jgi:hypothetical protein
MVAWALYLIHCLEQTLEVTGKAIILSVLLILLPPVIGWSFISQTGGRYE